MHARFLFPWGVGFSFKACLLLYTRNTLWHPRRSSCLQDEDLAFCIHSTGGLVLPSIPPSGEIYPIVAVSNKLSATQYTPMGYNPIAHVTPTELLVGCSKHLQAHVYLFHLDLS